MGSVCYRGRDVHEVDLSVVFVLRFGEVKGELVVSHQVICKHSGNSTHLKSYVTMQVIQ